VIATSQDYRRITGDLNSYDGDVLTALGEAQAEFLRQTGRKIELGTYTETLPVYDDGCVYPTGTPITGVIDPASASFDEISVAVPAASSNSLDPAVWPGYYPAYSGYAYGAYTGGYEPAPSDLLIGSDRRLPRPRRVVTYTGGYAPPPSDVIRCVCEMAAISLHPDLQLQLPGGTRSVTLGDQSVTGSFGSTTAWPPSVTSVIGKYTRTDP
jgi:hypothetical protein